MSASTSTFTLPGYFEKDGEEYWFSVGDRVYGLLKVRGDVVTYRFNDGSRSYEDAHTFDGADKALRFAAKFAAEMRRCDKRSSVPTLGAFREF